MSGLARLLAGTTPAGIYRWGSSTGSDDVRHTVERAGWQFVCLDTWRVEDKGGFLESCTAAFGFGSLDEHSFDGLEDALNDVQAGDSSGIVVLWDGWGPFARADRLAFDVALDVFDARVDERRAGAFAVLLKGPGPEADVPDLDPRHL